MEPSAAPFTPPEATQHGNRGDSTATLAMKLGHHRPRTRWTQRKSTWALAVVVLTLLVATTSHTGSAWRLRRHQEYHDFHHDRRLTVFGVDDRQAVSNPTSSPYSAVGLLKWSADRNCTAALIGTKYALTAADCVFTRDGSRRPSTLLKPELVLAGASTVARVVKIHRQSVFWRQWTQETYAILELETNVSETLGKLLLPTADELDQTGGKTPVQMVGFDGDVVTSTNPELKFAKCVCAFPATFNGPQYMLHHNCATSANGSPGSVLLVRYADMQTYIIGIHTNTIGEGVAPVETDLLLPVASYNDAVANRGVLAPFVQQHLTAILKNATQEESQTSSMGSSTGSANGAVAVTTAPPTPTIPRGNETRVETATTETRISSETAYTCIGVVAAAWICIVFIIVRHVRRTK